MATSYLVLPVNVAIPHAHDHFDYSIKRIQVTGKKECVSADDLRKLAGLADQRYH